MRDKLRGAPSSRRSRRQKRRWSSGLTNRYLSPTPWMRAELVRVAVIDRSLLSLIARLREPGDLMISRFLYEHPVLSDQFVTSARLSRVERTLKWTISSDWVPGGRQVPGAVHHPGDLVPAATARLDLPDRRAPGDRAR